MEELNNLLAAKEVSKLLGINLRTVQRLTKQGKIKGIKIGDLWRYKRQDIENYLSFGTDFSREPIRLSGEFRERRVYPRINTNFRCGYSINLPPLKEISSEGIIKNISAGGVFLINKDNVEVDMDDPINLQFVLTTPDKTAYINTEGRIVRKDGTGVGIKFRNLNEEIKDRIIQYIG